MQESVAQWLHQAVPAYNTLLEHVSSLPYQLAAPGECSTNIASGRLCIILLFFNILLETSCLALNEASQAPKGFRSILHACCRSGLAADAEV